MSTKDFRDQLERYLNGQLSDVELEDFLHALSAPDSRDQIFENMSNGFGKAQSGATSKKQAQSSFIRFSKMYLSRGKERTAKTTIKYLWSRITTKSFLAAVAVIIMILATVWLNRPRPVVPKAASMQQISMVAPANKTTITLQSGKTFVLDSNAIGILKNEGLAVNLDVSLGAITYRLQSTASTKQEQYHTLITGKGAQYLVVLAGGTKIWLSTNTVLQYPIGFTHQTSILQLNGEAYFEVAAAASIPFKVQTPKALITVIGTRFNLSAYGSEPSLKTTLLQGKIQVSDSNHLAILKAGQQLYIHPSGTWQVHAGADTAAAIAWKDSIFDFRNTELTSLMRQVEKWYDLQAVFTDGVDKHTFTGRISRKEGLTGLLQVLKESNLHFRKEGNKIVFFR
ncbi:FecR family protein [Chitinophaga sp. CC14]|uniref:FecR family protein n=1 Tax=Chitinophaga sp. CC14 TaxID=3029199 RepID=UPI003B7F9409